MCIFNPSPRNVLLEFHSFLCHKWYGAACYQPSGNAIAVTIWVGRYTAGRGLGGGTVVGLCRRWLHYSLWHGMCRLHLSPPPHPYTLPTHFSLLFRYQKVNMLLWEGGLCIPLSPLVWVSAHWFVAHIYQTTSGVVNAGRISPLQHKMLYTPTMM